VTTAEHDRAEALAIMTADGDVTEAQAVAVLDCADAAAFDRAMGDEPTCTCGAHATPERVAIVGSRGCYRLDSIIGFVGSLATTTVVISGGATGPDSIAAKHARGRGLEVVEHLPDYEKHGKRAPLVRNTLIVDDCDRLVAFWDGVSRGTLDSINKAKRAGKPVEVHR